MGTLCEHKQRSHSEVLSPTEYRALLRYFISLPECRHLLHRIHSVQRKQGLKSILLLSQFPKEGKSFLTSVLAEAASSLLSQRVLIVDTNSSAPEDSPFDRYLCSTKSDTAPGTLEGSGTIDLLIAKKYSPDDISPRHSMGVNETLNAIPSDFEVGGYLSSIREHYDLLLIDGCALRCLNRETFHPSILASHSDSTIIVASPRSIERSALASMKELLSQHGIRPIGIVHNRWGLA